VTDDQAEIKALIERWAAAVHAGDLDAVLADHARDLVMFDVPPPEEGVRGLDEYRATWPDFFRWQASGALFEITSLDVVAGGGVGFAYALLRCGTPDELAARPERRLRLTVGLRKDDGRWVVLHEHHSFTDDSLAEAQDGEREIRDIHRGWFDSTAAKDLDGQLAHVADDVVAYEHEAPLRHVGVAEVREVCRRGLESSAGAVSWTMPELDVVVDGDLAVAWGLNRMTAENDEGATVESWSRGTRVFRRTGRGWELTHQHVSFPYDLETGGARTDLRP
jgi:uncharacterized protein (TIGR02246 family)